MSLRKEGLVLLVACPDCHRQYQTQGVKPGASIHCHCGESVRVRTAPYHDARMLHCSSCGANLPAGATSCGYCRSGVTLADHKLGLACPECFARLRHEARFCAECGVSIDPEQVRANVVSESCPRCKGIMVLRTSQAGAFSECTDCGGLWLDETSFDKAVLKRDQESLAIYVSMPLERDAKALDPAGHARPELNTDRYIPCPVCSQFMNRKNFATCSGVVIDWCKGHGYWFDASELARILAFVEAGGMDRARSREIREAEKQVERAKRRVAQVRNSSLSMDSSFPVSAWGSSSSRFDLFDLLGTLVRGWFRP